MYGMVLMAAMTGTGDAASFGKHKDGCGCTGSSAYAGCHGGGKHHMFGGGCHGGGLFAGKHAHGCHGAYAGCHGAYAGGCTGIVTAPVAVAPAPVAPPVVAPAPVVAAAPACCPAPTCCEKHKRGLFGGGLCKKKHSCEVSYATPCCATGVAPVMVPAGPAVMPMPDKKPIDKKPGAGD
jgi:hypothetical protein